MRNSHRTYVRAGTQKDARRLQWALVELLVESQAFLRLLTLPSIGVAFFKSGFIECKLLPTPTLVSLMLSVTPSLVPDPLAKPQGSMHRARHMHIRRSVDFVGISRSAAGTQHVHSTAGSKHSRCTFFSPLSVWRLYDVPPSRLLSSFLRILLLFLLGFLSSASSPLIPPLCFLSAVQLTVPTDSDGQLTSGRPARPMA